MLWSHMYICACRLSQKRSCEFRRQSIMRLCRASKMWERPAGPEPLACYGYIARKKKRTPARPPAAQAFLVNRCLLKMKRNGLFVLFVAMSQSGDIRIIKIISFKLLLYLINLLMNTGVYALRALTERDEKTTGIGFLCFFTLLKRR